MRTPLDLIIADYRMPRLTGLDLLGVAGEGRLSNPRHHHDRLSRIEWRRLDRGSGKPEQAVEQLE